MSTINYPGSFCIAIYDFIKISGGLNTWRLLLGALMLFAITWILLNGINTKNTTKNISRFKKLFLSKYTFIVILFIGTIILKLSNTILPEQNVDESNWIVNAATFYSGGILWKDVTGGTGGPLIFIPLSLLNVIGIGLNYNTVRFFGLVICILPSIYFFWKAILNLSNKVVAGIAILPLCFFFITTNTSDFIAYNSEHVPLLLATISIYLLLSLQFSQLNVSRLAILGIVLGLFPWAKLQAIPIGFVVGTLAIVEIITIKDKKPKAKLAYISILLLFVLLPTMLFATYIIMHGTTDAFLQSYIFDNLLYAQKGLGSPANSPTGYEKLKHFITKLNNNKELKLYIYSNISYAFLFLTVSFSVLHLKKLIIDRSIIYCTIILVAAYFSVTIPPNLFTHYILLFIMPFAILFGVILAKLVQNRDIFSFSKITWAGIMLIFGVSSFIMVRAGTKGAVFVAENGNYLLDSTAITIKEYSKPNEKMAIWGWAEKYHVYTGLILGNNAGAAGAILDSSSARTRLVRYMDDMNNNKPRIFLDAVAPTAFYFRDTAHFRHENYDTLKNYVIANYTLKSNFKGFRVYVLNEK